MKKLSILFLAIIALCSLQSFSQTDTLHLYYVGLQTKTADSTEAKITAWAKKLVGKHVDVEVLAYYNESGYKQYAQERSDELFLILNRKARDLITIKTIGPKKGVKSQRSMVDIVYTSVSSSSQPITENKQTKNDDLTNTNNANKTEINSKNNSSNQKNDKSNLASTSESKKNIEYTIDSVYINGVLKVTKRKVKKK